MRQRLLREALGQVNRYGWTREAIEVAAERVGLPRTAHGIVSGGETELVSFFVRQCNSDLGAAVGSIGELTMRERLRATCKKRLELVLPYETSWSEALAVLAAPYNVGVAAKLLGETSDEILHVCGDESTDMYWYSKRAAICAVYGSSELFMLSDTDPSKQETWRFLQQRLDNYAALVQTSSQLTKLLRRD